MKDQAELFLDTTGAGLHKRGYRAVGNDAPLRETLAAAMVNLARYRGRDNFVDPFCGSGTIAIEAAMIAKNRAPGLNRSFSCQKWDISKPELWQKARSEALDKEFYGDYHIYASDIDPKSLAIAQSNAKKAGMDKYITFSQADATQANAAGGKGVIVTNPPYGQRMMEHVRPSSCCGVLVAQWAVRRTMAFISFPPRRSWSGTTEGAAPKSGSSITV